jgi:hypothetical protein
LVSSGCPNGQALQRVFSPIDEVYRPSRHQFLRHPNGIPEIKHNINRTMSGITGDK